MKSLAPIAVQQPDGHRSGTSSRTQLAEAVAGVRKRKGDVGMEALELSGVVRAADAGVE